MAHVDLGRHTSRLVGATAPAARRQRPNERAARTHHRRVLDALEREAAARELRLSTATPSSSAAVQRRIAISQLAHLLHKVRWFAVPVLAATQAPALINVDATIRSPFPSAERHRRAKIPLPSPIVAWTAEEVELLLRAERRE